ncbi:MAG: hypothetical protein AAFN80_16895 [Pseudomonadota bacterium]
MIAFSLFFGSFIYAILTAQVATGFPPLYNGWEHKPRKNEITKKLFQSVGLYFLLIAVSFGLVLLTQITDYQAALFALAALFPAIVGWQVRRFVKSEFKMPFPFIDFFCPRSMRTRGVFVRFPMLLFDLWTLGLAILMGSLPLLSR